MFNISYYRERFSLTYHLYVLYVKLDNFIAINNVLIVAKFSTSDLIYIVLGI